MNRFFKLLALVVLSLVLLFPSFVPLGASTELGNLDIWRQATYQADVTDLAISPAFCDDQTLFVATDGAGVSQSRNAGGNWRTINKGLGNMHVFSLAISPDYHDNGNLFAGTDGGGVFRWDRGKDSWVSANLTNTTVSVLVASSPYAHRPREPLLEDLFAGTISSMGTTSGLYISESGGITWTLILSDTQVLSLAISPNYITDTTIFAGTTSGLYISENGGVTWTQTLSDTWICALAVSPNYTMDQTIFVGTCDAITPHGYSKISPRQVSRSSVASGGLQFRGRVIKLSIVASIAQQVCPVKTPLPWVNALAVFPGATCQPVILAGTPNGIFRLCQCDGQPIKVFDQGVSALAVGPPSCATGQMIFASGSAGVFKSADEGKSGTWASCREVGEVRNQSVNAILLSPNYAQDCTTYVATSKDGVLIFRCVDFSVLPGGPNAWNVRSLTAASCAGKCTLLAGAWSVGVYTTTCEGDTLWVLAGLGCVNSLAAASDGQGGSVVFAGTCNQGVYKATLTAAQDCQLNWQPSNGGLCYDNITALCASPAYVTDTTVFAGTYLGGIYKSTDGGVSWTTVSTTTAITTVLALAASPNYAQDRTVLAGTENGAYKSTDGGDSWRWVGPSCPVYALSFSPDYAKDQTVYAGTYGCGVFESRNGGESWAPMNASLGNLYVRSLAITPTRPWTLFAGTEGSGLWLYTMSYKIYLPLIMRSYADGW